MGLLVEVWYLGEFEGDTLSGLVSNYIKLSGEKLGSSHVALMVGNTVFSFDWYGARILTDEQVAELRSRLVSIQRVVAYPYEKDWQRSISLLFQRHERIVKLGYKFRVPQALAWVLTRKPMTCTGYVQFLLNLNITNPTPEQLYLHVDKELEKWYTHQSVQNTSTNTEQRTVEL